MAVVGVATLAASCITAVATAMSAVVLWRQWRGDVEVEWDVNWNRMYENSMPPSLRVTMTVRNFRRSGVAAARVKVMGPVRDVEVVGGPMPALALDEGELPTGLVIEPGSSGESTIAMRLDPPRVNEKRLGGARAAREESVRIEMMWVCKARRAKGTAKIDVPVPQDILDRRLRFPGDGAAR